jgi:High potential iron-sulfur protein
MISRRQLVLQIAPLVGAAMISTRIARAGELPALTETDPVAVALGFKLDAGEVNQTKYPMHASGQTCGNCLHYMKPGADHARCDIFNKTVPKRGWCSAYVKRA